MASDAWLLKTLDYVINIDIMKLVIVESPTKAKTIRKFLGSEYKVVASMGHVRDLPSSSDEVPAKWKKTEAGQLGVDVAHNFEPIYVISKDKTKVVKELKTLLKDADALYLASDEDREGESISWHLLQILKPTVPVYRMVFHEITAGAIKKALENPRELDERLVRAQETRRILDRLVGYSVSPVLWKKIAYGLSAGRVQSAALKAIVDRERERMKFKSAQYWDVTATLNKHEVFDARLIEYNGKTIAQSKDFDADSGLLKNDKAHLLTEAEANTLKDTAPKAKWTITDVQTKDVKRKAPAPFTTSTLQQEANRKLKLSSRDAMRAAQKLYENGFITYMRTDSTNLSTDAQTAIKGLVASRYGAEYVNEHVRQEKAQAGAQEAHEAIRPSLSFTVPGETGLKGAEHDVYELIWMRTIASQMRDAEQQQMAVKLEADKNIYQANGTRIVFPGFLRAYVEGADDVEQALVDREHPLPDLHVGDQPACESAKAESHETKPPARFTEASLVQFMEKEGIGRPSTYASVISTLTDRGYVHKAANALVPTFTAFAVTQVLERHLSDLVDVHFTSQMEGKLDQIAEGKLDYLSYLENFFLGEHGLKTRLATELEHIDPETAKTVDIPHAEGYTVRVGKFGPYVEKTLPNTGALVKASLPPNMGPGDATTESLDELIKESQKGPTTLGQDPDSGLQIYLRTGSYGPYLQLGEDAPEVDKKDKKTKVIKPKRVSIPKGVALETLDREQALSILSLPRLLGEHPETKKEIRAGLGRFGAYVVHDGDFRSIKEPDDVLTIGLDRALEMLAQPKFGRGKRAAAGTEIGKDPADGKVITLHDGKYGRYVKKGTINATIPKELGEGAITLEQALELIANKAPAKKTRSKK